MKRRKFLNDRTAVVYKSGVETYDTVEEEWEQLTILAEKISLYDDDIIKLYEFLKGVLDA